MSAEAAIILDELKKAIVANGSPWISRMDAAAYTGKSLSTLDRAADAGKFKRYKTDEEGGVTFKKKELDAWMEGKSK